MAAEAMDARNVLNRMIAKAFSKPPKIWHTYKTRQSPTLPPLPSQATQADRRPQSPTPPHHGLRRRLVRRRRRRGRLGGDDGQAPGRRGAGVPVLPGPVDAARHGPVGRHAGGRRRVRAPGLLHPRLLHRELRARDLPPQPPHRLPLAHGRPRARPLRRARRARAPHPRLRRVQALHPAPPRVQVLVCNHESFCYSFCDDILLCIRCPCVLAYTSLLLDCTLCPDDEAPDSAYGQVQICALQHREAEIRREEGWREQQLFKRLIPRVCKGMMEGRREDTVEG